MYSETLPPVHELAGKSVNDAGKYKSRLQSKLTHLSIDAHEHLPTSLLGLRCLWLCWH